MESGDLPEPLRPNDHTKDPAKDRNLLGNYCLTVDKVYANQIAARDIQSEFHLRRLWIKVGDRWTSLGRTEVEGVALTVVFKGPSGLVDLPHLVACFCYASQVLGRGGGKLHLLARHGRLQS